MMKMMMLITMIMCEDIGKVREMKIGQEDGENED